MLRLGRQVCVPCWGFGNSTLIAVMGNYYKQVFVSRGIHPDKIVVTGYPMLDKSPSQRNSANIKIFQDLKLQKSKPIILLLTQPFVEDNFINPRCAGFVY